MKVESLVQLIEAGNAAAVEDEWLNALADPTTTPESWAAYAPVLEGLVKSGEPARANELASTTIETLRERSNPIDALVAARAMLLALHQSHELRDLVRGLYLAAYADRPGIERLIAEAGLSGAHSARRALRTLEVCLALAPGSYLLKRHEDIPARVADVDKASWFVTVETLRGAQQLDPTHLADEFTPVAADDFRVLAHFDSGGLSARLEEDPVPLLIGILRAHGNRMTSDDLEGLLTARFIPAERWSNWWSRVRAQLKRVPEVRIEGRSPYVLVYDPHAETLEDQTRESLRGARDVAAARSVLEGYLRECRARKAEPDAELLTHAAQDLEDRAKRQWARGNKTALATLLVAARAREIVGQANPNRHAVELLRTVPDPLALIQAIEIPELWIPACDALESACPEGLVDQLAGLLRVAPPSVCDPIAERMAQRGSSPEEFDEIAQEAVAEPLERFNTLLWLWSGPRDAQVARSISPLTLLNRFLTVLAEMKRDDVLDRETTRSVKAGVRSALSARKYERFRTCLEQIDTGMASTLNTQIKRLDELGRAVKEDLLKILAARFPEIHARPKVEPWADPSVLYVTEQGLAAKEAEARDLVNVKMRDNAKAIGAAAAHGDLSENSEYKFALEERDLLRARLAQMNAELAMARVLSPDDVPRDRVGIGSRVTCRHSQTGDQRVITVLGPWEADSSRDVLNYKAPLAQALLGNTPGSSIELTFSDSPGIYIVESVQNALLSP